jgi:hypothetical protein
VLIIVLALDTPYLPSTRCMSKQIKAQTEFYLRDLHARESMRLSWYRHFKSDERIVYLREKKAQHQAFLNDLLRRRSLRPIWYARWLDLAGHFLGLASAYLPRPVTNWIEHTLEFWLLTRYEKYLQRLQLHFDLRSMIEAMQLGKLNHNEPGPDVLHLLQAHAQQERLLTQQNAAPTYGNIKS